jgi:UDP-N-acetylmuramyl pentapeptide phosphotransferase/UDP-N-acetylglucosamine-1-phosphate transferase
VVTAAALAFLVSITLQPLAIALLRRSGILDHPSHRSSHASATVRGGGLAVLAGITAGALTLGGSSMLTALLAAMLLAGAVGLAEDVHGVAVLPRLLLLLGAALPLAVYAGSRLHPVVGVVAVLYAVAVVNAVNFMDGINGISAAEGVAAGGAFAVTGYLLDEPMLAGFAATVAFATLAFLPYNVPKARVFLGDCGSYGLGAALAGASLLTWVAGAPIEAAVAPLALYLADTGSTLVRRYRAREVWHQPHRTHVYQRLTDLGWSHCSVSALVFLLVCICSLLGAGAAVSLPVRILGDLGLATVLAGYLALPKLLRERSVAA